MEDGNEVLRLFQSRRQDRAETAPIWLAKRKLAAELRRIGNTLCDSAASEEEILALADAIAAHADRLGSVEPQEERADSTSSPSPVPGMDTFHDRGPLTGRSNPISPPASLEVDVDGRRVVGEVRFGRAFEGAPGCVHGGFVAAVLDEALGMACVFAGGPAMTAELTTRYLRHTPIDKPLRIEARLDSVEGRRIRTSGCVSSDGVTVVDSTGLFIAVGSEKFAALLKTQRDGSP